MLARRAAFLVLLAAASARAALPIVDGEYDSPLGRVAIVHQGDAYLGRLVAPARGSPLRAGDEVLRATLLDDSLAGQVRVPLAGAACTTSDAWGSAVLLVSARTLSGAVHAASRGCTSPLGRSGGIAFARAAASAGGSGAQPAPHGPDRARAKAALRDGAAWLAEGSFERARVRFLDAIATDPAIPEAYNGVGVTYRLRNDLPAALEWYKKALAVDPDFGDAYYNMACVYAIQGARALALRYLQVAALNGYATADTMEQDPDLESLRQEPAYRALVGGP